MVNVKRIMPACQSKAAGRENVRNGERVKR